MQLSRTTTRPSIVGVTGIRNLGNTCYMNSALQCLSRTGPLTHFFLHQKHLNVIQGVEDKYPITESYARVIRDLWSPESAGEKIPTGTVQDFKRTIGKFADQFAGYNQQDVAEFLGFLLDGLHEEMNAIQVKPYVELDTDGKPDSELATIAWDYFLSRGRSIIYDSFYGQMKSTRTCTVCGNTQCSFDPFSTLTVDLPIPENIAVEVELLWRKRRRTVYGLMVPRDSKVLQVRQELEKTGVLAIDLQLVIKLSYR